MDLIKFLLGAMFISLTGVLAPGPITAVTVGKGSESPWAGAWISIGHGIVEFPLMFLFLFGFGYLLKIPLVDGLIGALGGFFLLMMGIGMLKDMRKPPPDAIKDKRSPLIHGILLSAGNPYFLFWWAIVGVKLIEKSIGYGLIGFAAFALLHWICDLGWLLFLSMLSFKGKRFYGRRFQQLVFGICGVALVFFSGVFLFDAARIFYKMT